MPVSVIHKRLQPGSRRPALPSLLGDGLPERLRSTSIALLGIVAAAGLAIVGFALQLGFPLIASAPLPQPPAALEAGSERSRPEERPARRAATGPSATSATATAEPEADSPLDGADGSSPTAPTAPAAPDPVSDSDGAVLVTAPARTRPQREQPVDRPAAAESPVPVAAPVAPEPVEPIAASSEAPEPAPESVPAAPAATHPGNGNAYGKGNGKGVGSAGTPPGHATSGHGQGQPDE